MDDYEKGPFGGFEGAEAFTKMWADFASNMAKAGMSVPQEGTPPEGARIMRDAVLRAMSDYCEEFMRSPLFLESLKESLNQSIEFRRQMNEFLGRLHHEFQGTSRQDIDQVMNGLRHIEQRMVDGLDRLGERLGEMEKRLVALENGKPARKRATPSARKKRVVKKASKRTA